MVFAYIWNSVEIRIVGKVLCVSDDSPYEFGQVHLNGVSVFPNGFCVVFLREVGGIPHHFS